MAVLVHFSPRGARDFVTGAGARSDVYKTYTSEFIAAAYERDGDATALACYAGSKRGQLF
jgi:hypothetical protein